MSVSIDRIIHTLNLTASDAREETIKSIVESVFFHVDEEVENGNIIELIQLEFDISLFTHEVKETVEKLIDSGRIVSGKKGFLLSDDRKQEMLGLKLKLDEEKKQRRARLGSLISEIAVGEVSEDDENEILEVFTDYLYECFLLYGRKAVDIFLPTTNEDEIKNQNEIIGDFLSKVSNQRNKDIFKKLVEIFPQKLVSDDLEYLRGLAKKTECFYSLGLDKDLHEEIINLRIVDWVVFLDTNVLYSLLDLHKHPESIACKQLISLAKEHELQIKFTFTIDTQKELLNKRKDFDESILKTNYTQSQLRALMKSENLDAFSSSYFERKLLDPEGTAHPVEVIDSHIEILKQKGIEIYQTKFKHLREDENHLLNQISQFRNYEEFLNEVRIEKGFDAKNPKDIHLLEHDIFLREAILSLRNSRATSLNEIRYFGLTLDRLLLKYDKQQIKKSTDTLRIPTFFLPSVLLGRISKFLPLVTDDYRRAFITAISSVAFEDSNKKTSLILQQSVRKFHNMGIEDESLILSCVSRNVFLNEFEKQENDELLDRFIQSEVEKELKKLQHDKDEMSKELEKNRQIVESEKGVSTIQTKEFEQVKRKFNDLKERQQLFEQEFKKISKKANQPPKVIVQPQVEMDFRESDLINQNDGDFIVNFSHLKRTLYAGLNTIKDFVVWSFWGVFLVNILLYTFLILTLIVAPDSIESGGLFAIPLTMLIIAVGVRNSRVKEVVHLDKHIDLISAVVIFASLTLLGGFVLMQWSNIIQVWNS